MNTGMNTMKTKSYPQGVYILEENTSKLKQQGKNSKNYTMLSSAKC